MRRKEELLSELRKQFDAEKKRLGFSSTFEEINEMSYIEDMVLSSGFVSNQFSRQMINRMMESFESWINCLYSWVYPAPTNVVQLHESKQLSKEERKEIVAMVEKIMYFVRKNKRIAFKGLPKKEEADFVDEVLRFDTEVFTPFMLKYNLKFEVTWSKGSSQKDAQKETYGGAIA